MADSSFSFQLDPDALNALLTRVEKEQKEARENKPFTGAEDYTQGGYYNDPDWVMDRMETPITEDERKNPLIAEITSSPEYKALKTSQERNAFLQKAVTERNMQMFEERPGEMLTTLGDGIKTKQYNVKLESDNPDYDKSQPTGPNNQPKLTEEAKRTYIVPKPGAESTGFQRVVGGGILEGAQAVGNVVEGATDWLGITDPETDYVKENFPTYAPASEMEKVGQEIVSVVTGSVGGAALASKLEKTYNVSSKMAKYISKFWDEAKKVDPKQAKAKLELFLKGLVIERGANIGGALTISDDAQPLVGDNVAEALGLDPDDNRRIGHYIDNEVFSVGLNVLARGIGFGWNKGKKLFQGTGKVEKGAIDNRAIEAGLLILKEIDPNITSELPGTILAERARIMGQVMVDNKDFRLGVLGQKQMPDGTVVDLVPGGTIDLDSSTALMLGAKDYAEKAYGWRKSVMEPAEYEKMINEVATKVAENIVGLKQGRRSSEIIRTGESAINAQGERVLTEAADAAIPGGQAAAEAGAQRMAQEVADPVIEARRAVTQTEAGVEAATRMSDATMDKDVVIKMLDEARAKSALGDTAAEKQTFEQLTGEDLYRGWSRSRAAYKEAFDNLPNDIPVDIEDFVTQIETLAQRTNFFDDITPQVMKSDPFARTLSEFRPKKVGEEIVEIDGKEVAQPIMETMEEVVSRMESQGFDLKALYANLRPQVSRKIQQLTDLGEDPSALIKLKGVIDEYAENSGHPEFRAAMDLYEDYASTYLRTEPLRQYDTAAKNIVESVDVAPGVVKGQEDAYEIGMRALNMSEQAATPGYMDAFLNALTKSRGGNVTDEMAQAYIGMAIKSISRMSSSGARVNADTIKTAVQPFLDQLRATRPDSVKMFDDTVRNLEMVESGLADAKVAFKDAEANYQAVLKEAQEDAASKFVRGLEGPAPKPFEDTSVVWNSIFNAKDAPEQIDELMRRAVFANDKLAVDGIKSKYMSYLRDKIFTYKRTGFDAAGGEGSAVGVAREVSPKQLDDILSGDFDNTVTALNKIFADEPEKAQSIIRLMEVLNMSVNNRAIRGNNFGSTTVYDESLKKTVDRLIVLTLGVLNPVATKARNLSGLIIEGKQARIKEAIEFNLDMMLTDPSYFNTMMQAVAKNATDQSILELMTPYMARAAFSASKDKDSDIVGYEAVDDLEATQP